MALSSIKNAGLLLAIIPIFQEAANHEDADPGSAPMALASNAAARRLEEFYKELMFEFAILRMSVDKLVNGLGDLADKEREALKSGDEDAWESDSVVMSMQNRLGTGFSPFCSIFKNLSSSLEKLVQVKSTDLPVDHVCLPFPCFPSFCSSFPSASFSTPLIQLTHKADL